jgi:hypothetical protein
MSGFSSASTGLSVFKVDKPAAVTADKLKKHAFRSIDNNSEPLSFGWTNIDDMTDAEFRESPPEKGGFLCFALRADVRKVQSAVLKRVLQEALKAELEACRAAGKEKVSRARKKELK